MDFMDWLKIYPDYGFTLKSAPENSDKILSLFKKQKIEAKIVGKVTNDNTMTIQDKNEKKHYVTLKQTL